LAKLSIIIPVYNMKEQERQCLLSIRQTVRLPYEIIVVDDGSSADERISDAGTADNVRILHSDEHRGFSHAVNMGIQASVGEVVLFLHADTRLAPHTVEDMLDALIADSALGAVSAVAARTYERAQLIPDTTYQSWESFAEVAGEIRERGASPHPEILTEMFALMARRDAVNAAGLLDEQYQVPALAAYDYTVRMTRAGYGIASLPSVYVHHVESVHDQNQEEYDRQREKERESFHVKWNVSLDYSFYARIDLFPLMNLTREGLRVLEIGCACGATLREIKMHNPTAELYGVELNEHAAAIAAPFAEILSMNVENLDPAEIPERFDYIIMGDVIEHLLDPWTALANMRELLVPGGAVIASIPNVAHISNVYNLLNGYWSYQDMGLLDRTHYRFFTRCEIIKLFENAQLSVEQIQSKQISFPEGGAAIRDELLSLKNISVDPLDLDTYQWLVCGRRA